MYPERERGQDAGKAEEQRRCTGTAAGACGAVEAITETARRVVRTKFAHCYETGVCGAVVRGADNGQAGVVQAAAFNIGLLLRSERLGKPRQARGA